MEYIEILIRNNKFCLAWTAVTVDCGRWRQGWGSTLFDPNLGWGLTSSIAWCYFVHTVRGGRDISQWARVGARGSKECYGAMWLYDYSVIFHNSSHECILWTASVRDPLLYWGYSRNLIVCMYVLNCRCRRVNMIILE